jgi:hypothetical protein
VGETRFDRKKNVNCGHPNVPDVTITEIGKTFRVSSMHGVDQFLARPMYLFRRLCAAWLLMSCAGCCTAGPIFSTSQPNVIVFRAIGGYFPDLCAIEEGLLDEGICPTVAYPSAHEKITERIIAARNNGRFDGPLVIVGYSAGADKALLVSRRLADRGIEVDKLVLVEPSVNGRVPGNVKECFNIYKPQLWTEYVPIFRGCMVTAENPSTELRNYDVRDYNDGRYDWGNHFTLTMNPYIRDLIIDEVVATIDGVPEQEEVLDVQQPDSATQIGEEFHPPAQ